MFWLGVTSAQVPDPVWHSSTFTIDEDALPIGAAVLAASALQLLTGQAALFPRPTAHAKCSPQENRPVHHADAPTRDGAQRAG
jgi:hypothetical protein